MVLNKVRLKTPLSAKVNKNEYYNSRENYKLVEKLNTSDDEGG
jgi:hypothetical protein